MGNEYTVQVYTKICDDIFGAQYAYTERYRGEDLAEAVEAMVDARNEGITCIRLTWRPHTHSS